MSAPRGVFTYRALAPTWRSRRQPGSREIPTGLRLKEEAAGEVAIDPRELKWAGAGGRDGEAGLPRAVTCSFACTWIPDTPSSLRILSVYEAAHIGCCFGPCLETPGASDSSVLAGTTLWFQKHTKNEKLTCTCMITNRGVREATAYVSEKAHEEMSPLNRTREDTARHAAWRDGRPGKAPGPLCFANSFPARPESSLSSETASGRFPPLGRGGGPRPQAHRPRVLLGSPSLARGAPPGPAPWLCGGRHPRGRSADPGVSVCGPPCPCAFGLRLKRHGKHF